MRLLFSVMLAGLLLGATADAEQNQRSERKTGGPNMTGWSCTAMSAWSSRQGM